MKSVFVMVMLSGSAAIVAAPQPRPGEPTQARVWVQNREAHERIPVSVREVASDLVVRTQVTGIATVSLAPGTVVATRPGLQQWEYRAVVVPAGADPAAALRAAGSDGWETTGLLFPTAGGAQVLLKKPRP